MFDNLVQHMFCQDLKMKLGHFHFLIDAARSLLFQS